jgi:hypothetical protein
MIRRRTKKNDGCDNDVYNSGDGYLWSSALELCCPFWLRFREDLVDQQGGVISGIGSDSKEEIKKEERRKKKKEDLNLPGKSRKNEVKNGTMIC